MKRRRFVQALVGAPAASALLAQQPVGPAGSATHPPEEAPKIEATSPDVASEMVPRFFDAQQFSALQKLSDILMPAINGVPGALDTRAPEFLDFLVGTSPGERQQVYRAGLDALNSEAKKQYHKSFAEVDSAQADVLLAPAREAWTYDPPADPLARFLFTAKQDVRTATMNSREWNAAVSTGGRRAGGVGLYWYPIE